MPKARFFTHCTNFSEHNNILKNVTMENILKKRCIKIEKNEDENFQLFM